MSNQSNALQKHKDLVAQKTRDAHNSVTDTWRSLIRFAYIVSGVSLFIATIAVALAYKTASSIIVQNTVRTTDTFGQTIAVTGSVYRVPTGIQTHSFINTFIINSFSVVDSPAAMQRNYTEAQADCDPQSPVSGYLRDYWEKNSPLSTSGFWSASRSQEKIVEVVSLLDRGHFSNGSGEEYEVEFTVKPALGGGHLGDPQLYKGDIVLVSGANPSDENPWGLLVSRFSWSEMK